MKRISYVSLSVMFFLVGLLGCFASFSTVEFAEARYSSDSSAYGGVENTRVEKTINCSYKSEDSYVNPYEAPTFTPSVSNGCTVDSAGNAIVYYDIFYDELIPGYKHKYIWGGFTYGNQNQAAQDIFYSLRDLMGTNANGTTINGFKQGMASYVSRKGRNLQLTQATGSYNNINLEAVKSALRNQQPAIIFLDTFSVTFFSGYDYCDGYDEFKYVLYNGCHTMLIYGYKDIYYYDSNYNLIGRDVYFYVSNALTMERLSLFYVNDYCGIDDIYIVNIT